MGKAEWSFLKSWLTKGTYSYNQQVRDHFRDVDSTAHSATHPRAAALRACLIDADDSGLIALHKRLNFYFVVLECHKKPEIFGLPTLTYQDYFKFKPQIKLFFAQDHQDVEPGYHPVKGELSFRLMGVEPGTITIAQVNGWALKIKQEFGLNGGYVWSKGKEQYVYRDEDKGYQLRVLARSQADAQQLISKALSIEGNTPDWSRLNKSTSAEPSSAYPPNPGNQTILGKVSKKPRRRPLAQVRFLYAHLFIYGKPRPIVLVDRTNYFSEAIEVVR